MRKSFSKRFWEILFLMILALYFVSCEGDIDYNGDSYIGSNFIRYIYPNRYATDIVGYPLVFVQFMYYMDESTINQSTFTLKDNDGNPMSGEIFYSHTSYCNIFGCMPKAWALFELSSNLAPSTRYTATISGNVKDKDGNTMGNDYTWSFTTRADVGTGTWQDISTTNAPSSGSGHTWTGTEMIVWSGNSRTGGRYYPAYDTWWDISTTNAPSARSGNTAVWTGTEMIVWGGYESPSYLNTGSRYNPVTNTWQEISTTNAPSARKWHTAVWTGTEMIVWGGYESPSNLNTGSRYNPDTDTW